MANNLGGTLSTVVGGGMKEILNKSDVELLFFAVCRLMTGIGRGFCLPVCSSGQTSSI
jgi:hypothetical protein